MAHLSATQNPATLHRITVILGLQGLAFWEAWRWYGERASTDSSDALGLLILLVLVLILIGGRPADMRGRIFSLPLTLPILGILLYALGFLFLPPLFRAAIAVFTLGPSLYYTFYGRWPGLAVLVVLSLSLPVIPSLQFYFGYPLRLAAIAFTAPYLQAMGYAVEVQGTYLHWQDMILQFDAPCSGVKMLWAGLFSSLLAAIAYRLNIWRQAVLVTFSFVVFFAANVVRAASLFFLESGIAAAPASWHEGIGLISFGMALPLTIGAAHWLSRNAEKMEDLPTLALPSASTPALTPVPYLAMAYGLACLIAAATPFLAKPGRIGISSVSEIAFPGWPAQFEAHALTEQPLTPRESAFLTGFPGRTARFDLDDGRQLVLRWVTAPSRLLHPAEDCYRGISFSIDPIASLETRPDGRWRCFFAEKEGRRYRICERIAAADGSGHWTDIGHWYWAALFNSGEHTYWVYTLAERVE